MSNATTNEPAPASTTAPQTSTPTVQAPVPATPSFTSVSLYVGDLSPEVTEAMLFEKFQEVGPVASIRVCRDADTRRSLGYAYVNFQFPADAERALDTMNYCTIGSSPNPIRIMWSRRDPSIRKSGVGNVFIRNLSKDIDNKALYDTFSAFGNILSCHVAVDRVTNKSKGYAFVHFETKAAADAAIRSVNGMMLKDKKVYVGEFQTRRERDIFLNIPSNGERPIRNLYVKELDPTTTNEELREIFSKYGEISSAIVMPQRDNRFANSRFGFVCFKDPGSARAALEMNGKEIKGRTLYVGPAQKKEQRNAALNRRFETIKAERNNYVQGTNLYIKYLDDTIDDEKLRVEFSQFGTITSAKVMLDEQGKSRGFGFVSFSTPDNAQSALTNMNNRRVGSKPLYVCLAQSKDQRQAQLAASYQTRPNVGNRLMMPGQVYAYPVPPHVMYPGVLPGRGGRWGGPAGVQSGPTRGYMQQFSAIQPGTQGPRDQQGRGQRQPRRPAAPTQIGQQVQPVQGKQQGFNFKTNARNQGTADASMYAHEADAAALGSQSLTVHALTSAAPRVQKQMLGERLYPLVQQHEPHLAAKITGMLLEMDNSELLHFLESPNDLRAKIEEAVDALRQHMSSGGQIQQ